MRNKMLCVAATALFTFFLTAPAEGGDGQERPRPVNALVLLGEWFGDAYFPLQDEIASRGWTMKRVGVEAEYRGCYNKKRDIVLTSDILIPGMKDLSGYDCLIIPSGPQFRKFRENPVVLQFLRDAHAAGVLIASFCVGNFLVKAAGLTDLPDGQELFPDKVTLVGEGVLLGPRGGGPPPGDGFKSAPVKELCDAIERELLARHARGPGNDRRGPAAEPREVLEAVKNNDLAGVTALIAKDPGVVNARDAQGRTPLHLAARLGHRDLVALLLEKGADASAKNGVGGILLHSAAAGGLTALVGRMIEGGADVNAADDLGQTPLHAAASAGRKDTADLLIAKGANLKAVCRDGRSLLHCAAAGGLVELMERLLRAGFPADAPDRYGRTPLLKAAEGGSDTAAEFLLSRGAKVMSRDYYQQTPLHEAAFSGNLRLLEVLVQHGADVNALNEEGSTPLLYVTQAGREDVVDWLLAHGAKLDVRNKYNETPLTFPLGNGFLGLVEKLWPRAEALKDKSLLERYPLHRAAYLGIDRGVAFLLEKGLPVDLRDESGRTPFQRAAQGGSVDIARRLLDKGADVDAPDPEGSTPLHLAVKKGRTEMVRFLLEKGAAPGTQDDRGRTPLDLAREHGYPSIAGVLKDAGIEPSPGPGPPRVAALLDLPLKNGEAIVWSLGHCGFAVKTRSRLLVFDYFSRGWPRPERPSLANGFVDPEEIKDLEVVVFVSHSHGDHFDPVILGWRPTIKNLRYVFGWNAGKGEGIVDLPAPRATKAIDGMEIFTVNDEHDDVPEVAYMVKVDGLAIYHSGDYMGPLDAYRDDMAYLLKKAETIDIAFIGKFRQVESLKPRVVFPIHGFNREFMYGAFAREAAEKKTRSRIICPENKGDRFRLSAPERR